VARRCRQGTWSFVRGRLDASYLLGPLLLARGLNITLVSYRDRIDFGIVTCPEVVEGPWEIAAARPAAVAVLRRAARSVNAS